MIDPRIALQARGPQIKDPMEAVGRAMYLKSLLGNQKLRGVQTQRLQADFDEQQAFQKALAGGASMEELTRISPKYAGAFGKVTAEQFEAGKKRLAQVGQIAGSVLQTPAEQRPQAWEAARQQLVNLGADPAQIPWRYDENTEAQLKQLMLQAMEVGKQADVRFKEGQGRRDQEKLALEQRKADLETQKFMERAHQKDREFRLKRKEVAGKPPSFQEYYAHYLEDKSITKPTAADWIRARNEWKKGPSVAGRDVPFSPEVAAQKKELAQSGVGQLRIIQTLDEKGEPTQRIVRFKEGDTYPAGFNRYSTTPDDIDEVVDMIVRGELNPSITTYSRKDRTAIAGGLGRKEYNQAEAERDWKAIQRHMFSMQSAQQVRLRQAIGFAYDHLEIVDDLWEQWAKEARASGFKAVNKATLAIMSQLPGEPGALAQNLQAEINNFISEMGTVYKGGNASTDETLRLAASNLKAEWNERTWKKGIGLLKQSLRIRRNSIFTTRPVGITPGSPYMPPEVPKEDISGTKPLVEPVKVRNPEGRVGYISKAELPEALRQGYSEVK